VTNSGFKQAKRDFEKISTFRGILIEFNEKLEKLVYLTGMLDFTVCPHPIERGAIAE
jgi:hypothetical protein